MKSIKHVVLLSPGFARDEQDSTCMTFLQDYVLALKKYYPDIQLEIVTLQYPFDRTDYTWNGIQVFSAQGRNSTYLSRFFTWIRTWKTLSKLHKARKIDIIHSFWLTEASFLGSLFSRSYKIKALAYAIGQDSLPSNRYFIYRGFRKMRVVAMSPQIGLNLEENKIRAERIIPLGVDEHKIKVSENKRDIDLLGIGSLIPLKNFSLFLTIISNLCKKGYTLRSEIVGEGPELHLLKEKINALGLEHVVTLTGKISHKSVFEKLSRSRFLLHTSSFEGQSTVMMEAMAAGTHVVCFDVGRLDSPGKIHVCRSPDDMENALIHLLNSGDLDYSPQLLQRMEDMVEQFMEAYGN